MLLRKGSTGQEVERLQRALNVLLDRVPPLRPDGDFGGLTETAVQEAQALLRAAPTGALDGAGLSQVLGAARAAGWIEAPRPAGPTPWLDIARREIGQKEKGGLEANPRILAHIATFPYLASIPHKAQGVPMNLTDETAWCACFVNWCLLRAGQRGWTSAMAETWQSYGQPLDTPRPGAICVMFNPGLGASTTASGWHVGFWTGGAEPGRDPILLGGNQGNAVTEQAMQGEVRAYRWPA
ncbi:MAG: TIGR02594 family protein [Acetobacteraceae bacterium]|nr:TIGR02594 family protein [Acetobacteraceae bacterium]